MNMKPFTKEELERHKQCEFTTSEQISPTRKKIIQCTNLTAYRVKRMGEKQYLKEKGDASNPDHYEKEQTEPDEYVCRYHFENRYLYAESQIFAGNTPDKHDGYPDMSVYDYGRYTGKWTFRKFE